LIKAVWTRICNKIDLCQKLFLTKFIYDFSLSKKLKQLKPICKSHSKWNLKLFLCQMDGHCFSPHPYPCISISRSLHCFELSWPWRTSSSFFQRPKPRTKVCNIFLCLYAFCSFWDLLIVSEDSNARSRSISCA